MAATLLMDPAALDASRVIADRAALYSRLPQRAQFMQLDGVVSLDHPAGRAVAYRDVREDEWWCAAHVPGKPLLPGVLMLESAAQLAAYMERYSQPDFEGFIGFGGVDGAKFRQTVSPPARLWLICQRVDARSRRIICYVQGVVDGVLVFEANVTGLVVPLT